MSWKLRRPHQKPLSTFKIYLVNLFQTPCKYPYSNTVYTLLIPFWTLFHVTINEYVSQGHRKWKLKSRKPFFRTSGKLPFVITYVIPTYLYIQVRCSWANLKLDLGALTAYLIHIELIFNMKIEKKNKRKSKNGAKMTLSRKMVNGFG